MSLISSNFRCHVDKNNCRNSGIVHIRAITLGQKTSFLAGEKNRRDREAFVTAGAR
jgi:hypothetical protein